MIPIKIKIIPGATIPVYQSSGAAGADLFANLTEPLTIEPGGIALIPTGIQMEIPEGYEAQVRPRSGLALKNGLILLNSPGTIDSDYRGEVKVIAGNFGKEVFTVDPGMRIAQLVFAKVFKGFFIESENLNDTKRSSGGFGHTGVK